MSVHPFAGRVVVVAGEGERIDRIVAILATSGALLAVVGGGASAAEAQVWFRAEPGDPEVWNRVVPHVEQRLGPIDAAVTTTHLHTFVQQLLEPDFRRRGHGGVLDVDAADGTDAALRTLATLL